MTLTQLKNAIDKFVAVKQEKDLWDSNVLIELFDESGKRRLIVIEEVLHIQGDTGSDYYTFSTREIKK